MSNGTAKVTWKYPDWEEDYDVHLLESVERTLCGFAYEGQSGTTEQGFILSNKQINCRACIQKIRFCKEVPESELAAD